MTIEDILKEFHGEEGEGAKNPRWQALFQTLR